MARNKTNRKDGPQPQQAADHASDETLTGRVRRLL